jgi:7,8-dihydroneopterin aldolase/epimerase/oxygenase
MLTVSLKNIVLFGYHGVFEEEQILGGNFCLNIDLTIPETDKIISLNDTINYVSALEIVKNIFAKPENLLETIAQNIISELYHTDNRILNISVSIDKLNPPIQNFFGVVGVNISKSF